MALIPISRYPAQVDSSVDYPHGKARNAGSYQDGTGTPLERDWLNDLWGFLQALLVAGGLTPSGAPDTASASQYLDAVRAVSVDSTLQRNLTRALALRALDLAGVTPGTTLYVGAAAIAGKTVVVGKGGPPGVFSVQDTPLVVLSGVTLTGLNDVYKIIAGGGRLLAIGAGSTKNAFSTTDGAAWTIGGLTGLSGTPTDGVWDGTQFVISSTTGRAVHSTNGVAWTAATSGSDIHDALDWHPQSGLAALGTGKLVAAGSKTTGTVQAFAVSVDHGQTWALSGSIATSPDYATEGYIAGDGGAEVFWLGTPTGEDRLDLFVSTDAVTWAKRAELPGFPGSTSPKLHMCQDTGLIVAVQLSGIGGFFAAASVDRGRTWSDVAQYNIVRLESMAVARGRVFATIGTKLYASDVL
jgi:hypothetical protein